MRMFRRYRPPCYAQAGTHAGIPNNVDVTEADADRSVQFYFYTYNLLGDPGLNFFVVTSKS